MSHMLFSSEYNAEMTNSKLQAISSMCYDRRIINVALICRIQIANKNTCHHNKHQHLVKFCRIHTIFTHRIPRYMGYNIFVLSGLNIAQENNAGFFMTNFVNFFLCIEWAIPRFRTYRSGTLRWRSA